MADQQPQKAHAAMLDIYGKEACDRVAERVNAGGRIPVVIRGFIDAPFSDFEDGMQSFYVENVTFQEVAESEIMG